MIYILLTKITKVIKPLLIGLNMNEFMGVDWLELMSRTLIIWRSRDGKKMANRNQASLELMKCGLGWEKRRWQSKLVVEKERVGVLVRGGRHLSVANVSSHHTSFLFFQRLSSSFMILL